MTTPRAARMGGVDIARGGCTTGRFETSELRWPLRIGDVVRNDECGEQVCALTSWCVCMNEYTGGDQNTEVESWVVIRSGG